MTHIVNDQKVEYALEQAVQLYHYGQKPAAVRTFQRLLGIEDSPEVRDASSGLIYVAETSGIDVFEVHLKSFATRYMRTI